MSGQDMEQTVGHELVHMFDKCRAKVDFGNLDHLACTEVKTGFLVQ